VCHATGDCGNYIEWRRFGFRPFRRKIRPIRAPYAQSTIGWHHNPRIINNLEGPDIPFNTDDKPSDSDNMPTPRPVTCFRGVSRFDVVSPCRHGVDAASYQVHIECVTV
jgi:hypothetical protein